MNILHYLILHIATYYIAIPLVLMLNVPPLTRLIIYAVVFTTSNVLRRRYVYTPTDAYIDLLLDNGNLQELRDAANVTMH